MKLPIFGKFSRLNREFHPKNFPYFWNSRIQEYFKTAGIQVKGVSNLSVKLTVYLELSHFGGELQSEKIPAVISIPKIWTILKSREF